MNNKNLNLIERERERERDDERSSLLTNPLVGIVVGLVVGIIFAFAYTGPTANPPSGDVLPPVRLQSSTPGDQQTGNINVSGAALFGGNVGIGTTSSDHHLQIDGSEGEILRLHCTQTGGGNPTIEFSDADASDLSALLVNPTDSTGGYYFRTGGSNGQASTLMLIRNDGNVGIGTTGPGAKLDIRDGSIKIGPASIGTDSTAGIYFSNVGATADYSIHRTTGAWSSPDYQQLLLDWDTGIVIDGGSLYGKSGTVLQPNGGNVGIGTTGPDDTLSVSSDGTAKYNVHTRYKGGLSAATYNLFTFANNAAGEVWVYCAGNGNNEGRTGRVTFCHAHYGPGLILGTAEYVSSGGADADFTFGTDGHTLTIDFTGNPDSYYAVVRWTGGGTVSDP